MLTFILLLTLSSSTKSDFLQGVTACYISDIADAVEIRHIVGISDGDVSALQGVAEGGVVDVECASGYHFPAHQLSAGVQPQVRCLRGNWQPVGNLPPCIGVQCGDPGSSPRLILSSPALFHYPNNVTYACESGYELRGAATLVCGSDGKWSHSLPQCDKIVECDAPRRPANGEYFVEQQAIHAPLDTFYRGTTIEYTCHNGYRLLGGSARATCDEKGNWTGPPPICELVVCSQPVAPLYGRVINTWTSNQKPTFGRLIFYRCDRGGTTHSASCLADGQWSEPPPICEPPTTSPAWYPRTTSTTTKKPLPLARDCPPLVDIENGYAEGNSARPNSVVTFQCMQGYVLRGAGNATCMPDGTWQPNVLPSCTRPIPKLLLLVMYLGGALVGVLLVGAIVYLIAKRGRGSRSRYMRHSMKASPPRSHAEMHFLRKPIPVTDL